MSKTTVSIVNSSSEIQIMNLYREAGWWGPDDNISDITRIISGSFCFATANDGAKIVGMGRVISDGLSDAYIQDVFVLTLHRGKGLGKRIIDTLTAYCVKNNIKWIGLVAEPGTSDFYKKLGYKIKDDHILMLYNL